MRHVFVGREPGDDARHDAKRDERQEQDRGERGSGEHDAADDAHHFARACPERSRVAACDALMPP